MEVAKITSRGRITIPKAIRQAAGLHQCDVIAFEIEGDRLIVRKVVPGRNEYLHGPGERGRRPIHINTIEGYFRLAGVA